MGSAVQDGRRSRLRSLAAMTPRPSPSGRRLCRLAELPDGGGKGFWFGDGEQRHGIFLLRQGAAVFAYRNSCPHRGIVLDWQPDKFLDASGQFILCAMHSALFRIDDGFCVSGPCAGEALEAIEITISGDAIYLTEAPGN
jgi:nitrite reductase/ring-hydroxylating ferredoxin subunit